MKYSDTVGGIFLSRPNRFIAEVSIDGEIKTVHVKNTGRCRELLVRGARVILERAPAGAKRKTGYDIIAVYKGELLINMDSLSPNKAVMEFIPELFGNVSLIRPEKVHGDSRFDFYIEAGERRIFMEVKGVTLEENGVCRFPDAPTERGVKHLNGLAEAVSEGFEAYVFFVVQMCRAEFFTPNTDTDPEFAEALKRAVRRGVKVLCFTCEVTPDSMTINKPCKVML